MIIYLVVLATIPVLGNLIRSRKLFCAVVSVELFLLLACRAVTVGFDLQNYRVGYEYISLLGFKSMVSRLHLVTTADLIWPLSFESGYVLLNWLISRFGVDFHGFLVCHAAICIFSLNHFVKKFSVSPWMSYLIVCCIGTYNYMFGILRQSLALSIILWACPYFTQKKIKSVILILLAFSIHRVSLIFVLLLVLSKINISRKIYWRFLLLCIVEILAAPILYQTVVIWLLQKMNIYGYMGSTFKLNNLLVLMLFIAIFAGRMIDFDRIDDPRLNTILWGVLLFFPIEAIGLCNENVARGAQMFLPFVAVLVPYIVENYFVRSSKRIISISMILMLLVFEASIISNSPMVPYVLFRG